MFLFKQFCDIFLTETLGYFAAFFSAAEFIHRFIVKYDIGLWIKGIMALFIISVLFSDIFLLAFERFILFLQSIKINDMFSKKD